MLAADFVRTPLQSHSIDMDLASGRYLNLMNKPRHCILPALFSSLVTQS
jgi:hypothetical protein